MVCREMRRYEVEKLRCGVSTCPDHPFVALQGCLQLPLAALS